MTRKATVEKPAADPFREFIARLETIDAGLQRDGVKKMHLLPVMSAVKKAARREYQDFNMEAVHLNRTILRNAIGILEKRTPGPAEREQVITELLEKTLLATEDAAIRAGFMVGLARGTAFASLLAEKAMGKPQRRQRGRLVVGNKKGGR